MGYIRNMIRVLSKVTFYLLQDGRTSLPVQFCVYNSMSGALFAERGFLLFEKSPAEGPQPPGTPRTTLPLRHAKYHPTGAIRP